MKTFQKGSVSVYALLILVVVMIASAGAVSYSYTSMARSKSDVRASTSYNVAQAALEYGLTKAYMDVLASEGYFSARKDSFLDDVKDIAPKCTAAVTSVVPVNLAQDAWVTSSATVDGRTSSIRTFVKAKDVGIWNNAVFAGSGASGQAINGNVDVRGSMHILGDGEPFIDTNGNSKWDGAESYTDSNGNGKYDAGEPFSDSDNNGVWTPEEPYNDVNSNGAFDPPMTETDLNSSLSGDAGVFNHYDGIPPELLASTPAPPTVNGVQTLNAEVRVKNGMIGLSGTAAIGNEKEVNGGTAKRTIDGSYVSAGYTGSGGANSVYSDNGTSNGYDLGNLGISFPLISGIGADKYVDKGKNTWNTQEEFLNARSLSITETKITSKTPAFVHGPDMYGNAIAFIPAGFKGIPPAKLIINGIVKVPDGFQLGEKDRITFAGNGTFYSPGNMQIDGDVLPAAGFLFPMTARVGFITKKDLLLATGSGSSQLMLCGAFYAQGKIQSAKQNQIMGTFVSSFYDLGTNVPKIYQVPTLSKNLPPGMPGDRAYVTMKQDTWRVRKT